MIGTPSPRWPWFTGKPNPASSGTLWDMHGADAFGFHNPVVHELSLRRCELRDRSPKEKRLTPLIKHALVRAVGGFPPAR
ncbi:hypothetical protein GCM10025787_53960 [Saccharopolyspora rosea]